MEQRLSLITLGVADLPRAKRFYELLGWRGHEVEETVFFQAGGLALVLWDRSKLAEDSGAPDAAIDGFDGFDGFDGVVLAQNVRSRQEVDEVVGAAEGAGATVTRPPAATFYGGYAGCFADPDGHIWEIAHNPGFTIAEDGSLVLPDFGSPT